KSGHILHVAARHARCSTSTGAYATCRDLTVRLVPSRVPPLHRISTPTRNCTAGPLPVPIARTVWNASNRIAGVGPGLVLSFAPTVAANISTHIVGDGC